jgi:hypothetical protein
MSPSATTLLAAIADGWRPTPCPRCKGRARFRKGWRVWDCEACGASGYVGLTPWQAAIYLLSLPLVIYGASR